MRTVLRLLLVFFVVGVVQKAEARFATPVVSTSKAVLDYPRNVEFSAEINNADDVQRIILEYGINKRTCGPASAEAFPVFATGSTISIKWTWEMLKSGSEPPGTHIWYQWKLILKDGSAVTSERKEFIWLNQALSWSTIKKGNLFLHWYDGSESFAQSILDAADTGLQKLAKNTGLTAKQPIHIYIFKDYAALREAVLYQPGWIGGIAFSDYNITTMGISTSNLDWGKGAIVHELTHLLVGNMVSGCIVNMPAWLNEGIAVYSQGGPDVDGMILFNLSSRIGNLLPIRSLSGSFSEEPGKADISYSQSYSIVNYLITTYGQEQLSKLFQNLNDGQTVEMALQNAYGFGLDELEKRWREFIGVTAQSTRPTPTLVATPTIIPTYAPASGN